MRYSALLNSYCIVRGTDLSVLLFFFTMYTVDLMCVLLLTQALY
jgi:hypothetical protein